MSLIIIASEEQNESELSFCPSDASISDIFYMTKKQKNILVIGGGTGTSVLLAGLKRYPVTLSAIITTGDDGSSSGMLRKEFNMIPPGDIRQCLIALAHGNFSYLNDRFQKGSLHGHTLGNLLITLFYQKNNDFQQAIDQLLELVGAQGSLIPMTLRPATLIATLQNGKKLKGEHAITTSKEIYGNLKKLSLLPVLIQANPRAIKIINEADVIVVGPGNLYSSVLPNLLVPEIKKALIASRAKKIYVANLFTQAGHTDNFSVRDFLAVLKQYLGADIFDQVIYNTAVLAPSLVKEYAGAIGSPVRFSADMKKDKQFVGKSLVSSLVRRNSADPIAKTRNPFLHDSRKLAAAVMGVIS